MKLAYSKIVKDEITSIINSSRQTALQDDNITQEEAELLQVLIQHLDLIRTEILPILNSLEDTINEGEIRKRVRLVARDIIPNLTKVAEKDGEITPDEAMLIENILSQIM